MPKDTEIESVLLTTLRNADFDTATLKSIREDVVKQLDLPQDFFKDKKWRQKSTDMADLVMVNTLILASSFAVKKLKIVILDGARSYIITTGTYSISQKDSQHQIAKK